jgi:phosphatidylglycerol lysyltransferase
MVMKVVNNLITRCRQYLVRHKARLKQSWAIWLVGFVTFLNGGWSIASILLTRLPQRVQYFLPFGVFHWTRSLTLVLGFILVYLSLHLLQRRRAAWWVAVFTAAIEVVAHLIHLHTWYTALPQAAALTLLLIFRSRFTVRSESRNIKLGFVLLFCSLLIALAYGTFGFWMLAKNDFDITFSLQDGLVRSLRQFLLLGNADITAATRQASWFLQSLDILGIVADSFASYSLFRPIVYRLIELPMERARAIAILNKYGKSTFDYFKVWPDKSFYFSPSRQSFIAYRMVNGLAFCLAGPVGPEEDREAVIQSFLKFCTESGWQAAVMFPDDATDYTKYGFSLFRVGEEATVDLERFAVKSIDTPHFRRVGRKFEKEGFRVVRYKPPVHARVLDEAQQVSRQWLTLPHHREYGFFQGRFDRGYMEKCTLSALRDKNGTMVAFVNEVPSYRPGEAYFDLMRYIPGSHWGTMDFFFAQMMLTLKNEGYRTFNFAVAPFVGMGDRPDATLMEKAINQIFERLDWFLHSKGIRQYKLKFEPEWRDVFVAYQGGPMGLLRVALNVNRIL